MRVVAQRVSRAAVTVDGEVVGRIGEGLMVLVGVTLTDVPADATAIADKLAHLRVFPDERGTMNRSLLEVGGAVLAVSQFTLYADTRRGRRPSYSAAAPPELAAPLVDALAVRLRETGLTVETGRFGAMMEVAMINQGPVTIILEAREGKLV